VVFFFQGGGEGVDLVVTITQHDMCTANEKDKEYNKDGDDDENNNNNNNNKPIASSN
jgi:hypothetical protein